MKVILPCLCLLISFVTQAGYIDYYNTINEGEYHMYEGNYELAVTNFEMAFEMVDSPLARDLFFASKCYSQLNERNKMYTYLERSLSQGLDTLRLDWDSLWFTNFKYETRYKNLIRDFYKPRNNWETNDLCNTALKQLRDEYDPYYFWPEAYPKSDTSTTKDSLIFVDERAAYMLKMERLLVDIFMTYGIPKQKEGQKIIKNYCWWLIQSGIPEYDTIVYLFDEALETGIISPLYYAKIWNFSYTLNGKTFESNWQNKYGLSPFKPEKLDEIIENRQSIGLSIYYDAAPDYVKGYKPEPISNRFIKPKIESTSSN